MDREPIYWPRPERDRHGRGRLTKRMRRLKMLLDLVVRVETRRETIKEKQRMEGLHCNG